MDSGKGNFVPIKDEEDLKQKVKQFPKHGGLFHVGEIVELKGSKFRVNSILYREIRLKLLPK